MLSAEERIDGRLKLCEYLGVPEGTGAYDIPCLTEQGILPEESDPVTSYALTEAIYRVLIQSDRTHLPTRKPQDWLLIVWSWIMCSIAAFFASLAFFFSKFGPKKMSSSIHTPLLSLPTPLLNTPQNKLFTPHSFKQHSHPTLHTPHRALVI